MRLSSSLTSTYSKKHELNTHVGGMNFLSSSQHLEVGQRFVSDRLVGNHERSQRGRFACLHAQNYFEEVSWDGNLVFADHLQYVTE